MERIDVVILGVGVLVLVASIIGVVLYEPAAGEEFAVTYGTTESTLAEPAAQSGGAQAFTFDAAVDATGIVDLHFDVSASTGSARATADQIQIEVSGPGGRSGTGSFSMGPGPTGTGSTRVSVHIRDLPAATTVAASDEATARATAEGANAWTDGSGAWTVTVTVTGGTGAPGPAAPSYTVNVRAVGDVVSIASLTPAGP